MAQKCSEIARPSVPAVPDEKESPRMSRCWSEVGPKWVSRAPGNEFQWQESVGKIWVFPSPIAGWFIMDQK